MALEGKSVKALRDRPRLFPELRLVWDSFWELNESRAIGMDVGPIPISEIAAFCEFVDVGDRGRFLRLVRSMDRVFLDDVRARRATAEKKPRTAVPPSTRGKR